MDPIKILSIIPARGGSKGIKNKNIRKVLGKPLINYTIEAAIKSELFSNICVCTDDYMIKSIVDGYCINSILRPSHLAEDNSPIEATILFVIDWYRKIRVEFDLICLLQPTSPLRTHLHIQEAFKLFFENSVNESLFSVCQSHHHPLKGFKFDSQNKCLVPLIDIATLSMPRQKLPKILFQNGAIYIVGTKKFIENKRLFVAPCVPYEMSTLSSCDIDTEEDLIIVEALMNRNV